jgi:TP901 family phage tail tape measure protein
MVSVGEVSFGVRLDLGGLRGEVSRIDAALANQPVTLKVKLAETGVRAELNRLSQSLRDAERGITIAVKLDTRGVRAQLTQLERELKGQGIKVPITATAPTGRTPTTPARGAQADDLSKEFDKTAVALEKMAAQAAKLSLKRQEQEAVALARELQRAEKAAAAADAKAKQISFKSQQQEVAAFAREFDKAAAAQQRLQQQSSRDQQILGGAKFNDSEIKRVEAAMARVRAETQKTDQIAALLRQKYGLADAEAQKLAGSLGTVNQQGRGLASTLDTFGNNLIARFFAFETAIAAVQAAVGTLAGAFAEASKSYREFESNILSFESKSQGTGVNLESLSDEILRVAANTSQSPVTLSAAADELGGLGVAATEVEGRLDSLAKAADVLKESPIELAQAFESGLVAYKQYGRTIEDVSNIAAQAIATTRVQDPKEFGQLFSKAAAPAAALGVELEELVSLYALIRATGALPEKGSTAIETTLLRIASQRDELLKEGVPLEFKENGGLDVEQTLSSLQERIKDLSTTDKIGFLKKIFDEKTASDLVTILGSLDGAYAEVATSIDKSNGAIQRGFDVVSKGTDFQAGLVKGSLESASNAFGEVFNPIEKGLIDLQQQVLEATNISLDPLTESADRLGLVLSENPELVKALADALSRIGNTAVEQLAAIADAVTVLVSDPAAIDAYANGIEGLIVAIGRFVQGTVGILDLLDGLFQEREIFPGVGASIADLLSPIGAFKAALEVIGAVLQEIGDRVTEFADRFPGLADAVINVIPGLRLAVEALQLLRGEAGKPIEPTAFTGSGGVGSRTAIRTPIAAAGPQQFGPQLPGEGLTFKQADEGLGAAAGLIKFKRDQDILLDQIEKRNSEAQIKLAESGADPEKVLDQERKTLQERVKAREGFIAQLQKLAGRTGISNEDADKVDKAIAEAEKNLAADRLAVAQNFQKSRAEVLRQATQDQQTALAEIDRGASALAATLAEQNLGPRETAAATAASEQDALKARLDARRDFLADLQQLESEGGLTAEQALDIGNQIIEVETAINNDRVALAESTEAERQRVLQQSLDDQLAALQIYRDRQAQILDSQKADLEGQLSVLSAGNDVQVAQDNAAAADLGLERERLETIKAQADAVDDIATAREAERGIAALGQRAVEQQAAATRRQFAFKRQQLDLELKIARIEAQRQALIANIAVKEAELNVKKAIGAKASGEEVDNLREQLALRQDIANDADKGIQVTEQVFTSRREELGIEEQIAQTGDLQAAEDQRQESLGKAKELVDQEIEAKQRLLDAEKALVDAERSRASALVSALQAQRATTAEAQEQLDLIRERFREAQGAGLFQGLGGEFEQAARQLEGILASGGQLNDLVNFAKNTDSQIARELLNGVGRGDVTALIDADAQKAEVAKAQTEAAAARKAADDILIAEIGNASEEMLIAFREGGAEAAGAISKALSFVSPSSGGVQSLRVGGVVDGAPGAIAPVQLHRDEFAFAPVGTRVVSQADSRRLVQEHLAATMPSLGPLPMPTLKLPEFGGGAVARRAFAQSMPTAAQLNTKTLEKRFDELIDIAARNAATKDGGQTNYFSLSGQSEAARMAAELRRLGRLSRGGVL